MILIENGLVFELEGDTDFPRKADVLIDGNRIAAVAPDLRRTLAAKPGAPADGIPPGTRVIDARGKMLVPGFFNAHYHSHDTLLKGMFETIPLELWGILALPPSYPRRSKAELRARTLIGAIECLYSGITTVQDMDRVHPYDREDIEVVLKAYDDVGIRCVFAPHFSDVGLRESTAYWEELIPESEAWRLSGSAGPLFPPGADILGQIGSDIRAWKGRYSRITFGLGPSSPERLKRTTLEGIVDLAKAESIPVYIHVNESRMMAVQGVLHLQDYGGSQVKYLQACGALGPTTSLAHSVWFTDEELAVIQSTGTTVALNPVGNLKTRSGVAPFRAYVESGINVGLGCDNCSCSDAQNMFQAMKMFCALAAVADPMPGPPLAVDALRAAMRGGLQPPRLGNDLGAIAPGKLADLFLVDLRDPSFVPLNSAARQLVFTESGRAVKTVIVDGRVVLEDGRVTTIDEAALADEIAELGRQLRKDAKEVAERLAPLRDAVLESVGRTWQVPMAIHRHLGIAGKKY